MLAFKIVLEVHIHIVNHVFLFPGSHSVILVVLRYTFSFEKMAQWNHFTLLLYSIAFFQNHFTLLLYSIAFFQSCVTCVRLNSFTSRSEVQCLKAQCNYIMRFWFLYNQNGTPSIQSKCHRKDGVAKLFIFIGKIFTREIICMNWWGMNWYHRLGKFKMSKVFASMLWCSDVTAISNQDDTVQIM